MGEVNNKGVKKRGKKKLTLLPVDRLNSDRLKRQNDLFILHIIRFFSSVFKSGIYEKNDTSLKVCSDHCFSEIYFRFSSKLYLLI